MKISSHPMPQSGFSLVEVLIAVVVISLGLGGLALMLITSVQGTVEARNRTMAAVQMSSLAELILLNPSSIGHYVTAVDHSPDCVTSSDCTGEAWETDNLAQWQQALESNLSGARGLVCRDASPADGDAGDPACDGAGRAVVKVFWEEPLRGRDAAAKLHRASLPLHD